MICKYNCFWWHITTDLPTHILVWFWYTHIIAIVGHALQWPYWELFTDRICSFVLFFLLSVKPDFRISTEFSYKQSFIHFIVKYFHTILEVFYKRINILFLIWINDTLMIVNILVNTINSLRLKLKVYYEAQTFHNI